ncbi:MAG: hypothetical protein V1857_06545 [archaeon]
MGIILVTLGFYGSYHNWHGRGYWAPRYLLGPLPLLVLSLDSGTKRYSSSLYHRILIAVLTACGFAVNLLGVIIFYLSGFVAVWSVRGDEWLEKALCVPALSPIYQHWILATTNLLVYRDSGYGMRDPGDRFDPYLYNKYGLVSLGIMFAVVLILALLICRILRSDEATTESA